MSTASVKRFLSKASEGFLSVVFPENIYCLCCGDSMENSRIHGICDSCAEKMDWDISNPLKSSMDEFAFDDVWPCCRYGFYPRRIISAFKLGSKPYAARPLSLLLAERLKMEHTDGALVAAVPMYFEKEKQRGFNQAELLAEGAASDAGLDYRRGLLEKTAATKSMRLSDASQRRQIDEGIFRVRPGLESQTRGKHIVLVDDVVTTGSTCDACARALRHAGAARISVLCFAVTPGQSVMHMYGDNSSDEDFSWPDFPQPSPGAAGKDGE